MVALSIAALVVAFVVDNLMTKGNISNLPVGYRQLAIDHRLHFAMLEFFQTYANKTTFLCCQLNLS